MERRGQLAGTSSFHLFPFLLPQGLCHLGEGKSHFPTNYLGFEIMIIPPIHMSAVYWFLLLSTFLDYGRYIIWTWLIFFWARVSSSWGWLWLLISLPLLPSAWITCMRHCCVALFLLRWDTDGLFVLGRKPATDQSNNATKVHLGKKSFVGVYWQKIWVRGYKSKDDSKTPASLKIPPQCRWEMES